MSKTGKEKTFEKSTREIVAILLLIKVLNGVFWFTRAVNV